jgi:hypothetical protein
MDEKGISKANVTLNVPKEDGHAIDEFSPHCGENLLGGDWV